MVEAVFRFGSFRMEIVVNTTKFFQMFKMVLLSINQTAFIVLFLISLITTFIFYILSQPKDISDNIYIRISGKVYTGTKARETRDSGKHNAGTTRHASTAYVHSEVKFIISGDSEISVDRLRNDVGTISKYLQKI